MCPVPVGTGGSAPRGISSPWWNSAWHRERRGARLIVGPWSHQVAPWGRLPRGDNGEYQDRNFGEQALWDVIDMHTRWYDQRLKGVNTGIDRDPPIKLFGGGQERVAIRERMASGPH